MRKVVVWFAIMILLAGSVPAALAAPPNSGVGPSAGSSEFVVVYADGVSLDAARAAIRALGGVIVKENAQVGVATVRTSNPNFVAAVQGQRTLIGAASNSAIGQAPRDVRPMRDDIERLDQERQSMQGQLGQASSERNRARRDAEPLAGLQWDMQMIHATVDGSYRRQLGDKRVLVGIIDTGIDGSHPDIAPNFNRDLSRNFTTDIPLIDGACADDPDGSCDDPPDVDEQGHGTHVAGTVAAALNGLGIAGVAPKVTLVNLRAGQDSGYFFLQPVVDALTYAGDIGVDVVNMSFYLDPWRFNCANSPSDSPAAQQEQRAIIIAMNRALDYAHRHNVTLVGSAGNEHGDLGHPTSDTTSPDFPPGVIYPRTVDNSCLILPTEGHHVISVTAIGPSTAKADYSNYGTEQAAVSAPGGYSRDLFGTPLYRSVTNLVLAPFPAAIAQSSGVLNPDGTPNTPFVVQDCKGSVCAYYQYLQGTSMASPHVVGVVALIVSEYGHTDPHHKGGLTLDPAQVQRILYRTATPHACPNPRLVDYTPIGRPADWNATCAGGQGFNGFYGHGIVDALNAVRH
jgi:lantibiotic leader peptide-processing serine protease